MSNEANGRRAAREARRAARKAQANDEHEERELPGPLQAAREAATAAAVGAAVGAVKAFAEQQRAEQAEEPEEQFEDDEPNDAVEHDQDEPEPPQAEAPRRRDGREPREGMAPSDVERAVRSAREQVRLLKGADAESVSSFGRTRDGWRVTLEVLELQRIPETTDVLASYLVELDHDGNLVAFEQLRRYQRSEAAGS